jgi:uncharacterized membrane protein
MTWLPYALISAAAAAATAILAKVGIQGVPSNLATAIRTVVGDGSSSRALPILSAVRVP